MPVTLWLQLLSAFVAVFVFGVAVGQIPIVRDVVNAFQPGRFPSPATPANPASVPLQVQETHVNLVSGDLIVPVPLSDGVISVRMTYDVTGRASFSTEAKLKRTGVLGRRFFPDGKLPIHILRVKPEAPSVTNGQSSIVVDFDVSALKPDRQAVSQLQRGARTQVGRAYVDLSYHDGIAQRSKEITVPIFLTRQ